MVVSSSEMARPAICIVTGTYPPFVCGVSDYTARMVSALLPAFDVTVFTPSCGDLDPSLRGPGRVVHAFDRQPASLMNVVEPVREIAPEWLILQYDPYSYGNGSSINFYLPRMLRQVRRMLPSTHIAAVIHEGVNPHSNIRLVVRRVAQVSQLVLTGRSSDRMLFATQTWAGAYGRYVGKSKASHFRIFSNITKIPAQRDAVRRELGIGPDQFVVCFFGRANAAKAIHLVRAAVEKLRQAKIDVCLLYLGTDAPVVRNDLADLPLIARGPLSSDDVSRLLRAVDLYLVPVEEGVSTRRSSLLVALDHGLTVLTTFGPATDAILLEQNNRALVMVDPGDPSAFAQTAIALARDPQRRALLGEAGEAFYRSTFDESLFARRLSEVLAH